MGPSNKRNILLVYTLLFFMSFDVYGQTEYFTSFDTTQIAYTDEGSGHVVLLIHGFINTRRNWDKTELKQDLLSKGYRVIVPDLRGNGDSDKPQTEQAYANDAEVTDMMALIDYLEIKEYHAIGYSRGTIILAKLLTKDTRVQKAVLGGMGIDFTNPDWERRLLFSEAFAGNPNEMTQGAVDYAKSIQADLRSLHLQQKYQPVTSKEELALIENEVLVVAGDEDKENGNPADLHKTLSNALLKIVPGNHNETYRTKAFSDAILTFLSGS